MHSRILIASDLHLSQTIWRNRDEIVGDSYFGLNEIYEAAVANDVDRVFLLGDIFDTCNPAASDVVVYREFCDKLRSKNIRLFYLEGQHDRSSLRLQTNFRHLGWCDVDVHPVHAHGTVVDITDEIKAYCLDWQHRDELKFKLCTIPKECSWLFCHQAWAEMMGAEARSDGSFNDVPSHITSVFTGDKHQHGVFLHRDDTLKVYSPGCTHIRKKNEPTDSRIFIVQDGITRAVPIRSRIVKTFRIETQADTEKVKEALDRIKDPAKRMPPPVDKPIFFINYVKEFQSYIRMLRDNTDLFIITNLVASEEETNKKRREINAPNVLSNTPVDDIKEIIKGCLLQRVTENTDLRNLALTFLENKNPKKIVEAMISDLEKDT